MRVFELAETGGRFEPESTGGGVAMSQYIHAVPNFSEGRRSDVIEVIVAQLKGIPGVKLIDFYPDPAFNRTVVEVIGKPDPLKEALLNMAGKGIYIIGLDHHTGYILYDDSGMYFLHAAAACVKKESIHESVDILYGAQHGVFLGKLFDDRMLVAWLTNTNIPLIYRQRS